MVYKTVKHAKKREVGSIGEPSSLDGGTVIPPIMSNCDRTSGSECHKAHRTCRKVFVDEATVVDGLTPTAAHVLKGDKLLWDA
jgi:hypothetical protein